MWCIRSCILPQSRWLEVCYIHSIVKITGHMVIVFCLIHPIQPWKMIGWLSRSVIHLIWASYTEISFRDPWVTCVNEWGQDNFLLDYRGHICIVILLNLPPFPFYIREHTNVFIFSPHFVWLWVYSNVISHIRQFLPHNQQYNETP